MGPARYPLTFLFGVLAAVAILRGAGTTAERGPQDPLWVQKAQGRAFSFPCDIAVDRRGIAFLLDSGSRSVVLLTPGGEFVGEIQGKRIWKDPIALAVGTDGAVFIADGDAGRVLELDLSGKVRHEYPAGKNARVTGVGVFGDSVYCVDNRNDRVIVFKRGRGRTNAWGKGGDRPGEFHAPFRLAVDVSGRIFVTDVMNARVQWFSAFGQHLGTVKKFGAGEGKIFRPTSVSIDYKGRIWLGDGYTGFVQLFEENGNHVRSLADGTRPFVFGDPAGLAVSAEGIWVADQREGRIALFRK